MKQALPTQHLYCFSQICCMTPSAPRRLLCSTQVMPDDQSKLVPPLPIPNRTVKRLRADDSAATSVKVGHRQACYTASPRSRHAPGGLCVYRSSLFSLLGTSRCQLPRFPLPVSPPSLGPPAVPMTASIYRPTSSPALARPSYRTSIPCFTPIAAVFRFAVPVSIVRAPCALSMWVTAKQIPVQRPCPKVIDRVSSPVPTSSALSVHNLSLHRVLSQNGFPKSNHLV
jgi:hypothetical protein